MKQALRITCVLTVVCLLSGFFLSFAYNKLSGKIEENQQQTIKKNVLALVENGAYMEEETSEGEKYYLIFNKEKNLVGYAITEEGNGYQGKIKILVALKSDLNSLWGIQIIESQETPGLGAKINSTEFKNQFKGLIIIPQINLTKKEPENHNEISAISGATISSRAVVKITNKAIKKLKRILEK